MVIVSVSSFHPQPVRIRANDDIEFGKEVEKEEGDIALNRGRYGIAARRR